LMGGARGISETSEQLIKQAVQPDMRIELPDEGGTKETSEISEATRESLAKMFGEKAGDVATDAKGKKEAEEVQRRIETRLRYLTRMYTSNKDKQAEEEDDS